MELPVPDDISLDWSQVASGPLEVAERHVIVSHLKKITIPMERSGKVALFGKTGPLARNFKITALAAKPASRGTEIDFIAEDRF